MLGLTDVTVRRGRTLVVTALTREIRSGPVFWVTGPNGAGKSSLMRVLALLDPPAAGEIRYGLDPDERFLYFHSEMALPASSTVGAWERLTGRLLSARDRPDRTALWPDVEPGRRVGRLSTGERKRLLLDSLLRRRGPLLLDEPYEHLSPDAKSALTAALGDRARTRVVVVATNQIPPGTDVEAGIRLEAGAAEPLPAEAAS